MKYLVPGFLGSYPAPEGRRGLLGGPRSNSLCRSAALCLTALPVLLSGPISAQTTTRDSVLATVEGLFAAMENRDTTLALKVTDPSGMIMGIVVGNPEAVASRSSNGDWARRLANDGPALLERMWKPDVMIRGPLAVVWTQYDFHIDGKFSHCGIDAFTLLREGGMWRIVAVAFTEETAGCEPSRLGTPGQ